MDFSVDPADRSVFSDCNAIAEPFDGQFLENLPHLTTLDLAHNYGLTDEGLMTVTRLANLAFLDLRSCESITWNGLTHLSVLRFLTRVELQGCPQLLSKSRRPPLVHR